MSTTMLHRFILPPVFFSSDRLVRNIVLFSREQISALELMALSSVPVDFGRSLIAAYLLVLNGYSNVYHLEGGLYTWFKEGLPAVEGEE
jgi:hypothetical protein